MNRRPFRTALMTLEPFGLVGSRCGRCGVVTYPARDVCPGCRNPEPGETVSLSTDGVVHTFTVVRQAPPGVSVPYVLAYVDLPEGVRLMAQIDVADPEEVEIGLSVTLHPHTMGVDETGEELVGYRFRPTRLDFGGSNA